MEEGWNLLVKKSFVQVTLILRWVSYSELNTQLRLHDLPYKKELVKGYQNSSKGPGLNNKKLLRDVPKDRKNSGRMLKRSCERHPRNKNWEKNLSGVGSLQRRPLLTRNFKSGMWHDVKILPLMLSALKIESPEAKWSLWSGSISINFRMHKGAAYSRTSASVLQSSWWRDPSCSSPISLKASQEGKQWEIPYSWP